MLVPLISRLVEGDQVPLVHQDAPLRPVLGADDIDALTIGADSTDGTDFSGVTGPASISPTPGAAYFAAVISHTAGTPESPTVTGNDLTWVAADSATQGQRHITVYEGTGTPTEGAPAITFVGAQTAVAWAFVEVRGADTSDAVVQIKTNSTTANTTINATFDNALEHANNIALAFVGVSVASGVTPDAQFTELGTEAAVTATTVGLHVEWAAGQTTCDPTFASATAVIAMFEVRAGR